MASPAQLVANKQNAQLSTGPRTAEGKAAVAQNRTAHGLAGAFSVLPCEDPAQYAALLDALRAEHKPLTPTEDFLVEEIAQAQWRIRRADRIETEILTPSLDNAYAGIADKFRNEKALDRLARYTASARRTMYKALAELRALHSTFEKGVLRAHREDSADQMRRLRNYIEAPGPGVRIGLVEATVMPAHLERELASHRRRDPLFDPRMDASQMSKALRKWFENHPQAA